MGANASGKTIVFSYNEDGSRASKTVNGTRTDYIYNGSKVMRETSGGVAIDFIYDVDGRPFAMKRNGAYYYYILNLQGDVVMLVNASGATVASYEYDPYGKVISATGSMASINPLRYRGYYYDQETGMYFLQSRYYDPAICRFINADSFASTGQGILGYNMFAYCGNNPSNTLDITGHSFCNALNSGIGNRPNMLLNTIDSGGGGGSGTILILSTTILVPVVFDSIAEQMQAIKETLSRSLATAKTRLYRTDTEDHHIAAKGSHKAVQAATILNELFPGGVQNEINIVTIKTRVHRRIHTNLYYALVNEMVSQAYSSANGDIEKARVNVTATLLAIRGFIIALDEMDRT